MTGRARDSSDSAQLVRPGLASVCQPGGVESLHRCLTVWRDLSDTEMGIESRLQALDRMAQAFTFFPLSNGRKFERLRGFELQLHLPRVSEPQVRSWFGGVK